MERLREIIGSFLRDTRELGLAPYDRLYLELFGLFNLWLRSEYLILPTVKRNVRFYREYISATTTLPVMDDDRFTRRGRITMGLYDVFVRHHAATDALGNVIDDLTRECVVIGRDDDFNRFVDALRLMKRLTDRQGMSWTKPVELPLFFSHSFLITTERKGKLNDYLIDGLRKSDGSIEGLYLHPGWTSAIGGPTIVCTVQVVYRLPLGNDALTLLERQDTVGLLALERRWRRELRGRVGALPFPIVSRVESNVDTYLIDRSHFRKFFLGYDNVYRIRFNRRKRAAFIEVKAVNDGEGGWVRAESSFRIDPAAIYDIAVATVKDRLAQES